MSDIESAEDIRSRWNPSPTEGGLVRMLGDKVPDGDGRATAAYGNPEDTDSPFSSRVDASLPKGVETLTPDNGGQAASGGDYADWSFQELKDEIDERNEDRDDEDAISKGGSADDLRQRLSDDDAQPTDGDASN